MWHDKESSFTKGASEAGTVKNQYVLFFSLSNEVIFKFMFEIIFKFEIEKKKDKITVYVNDCEKNIRFKIEFCSVCLKY